MQPVCSPSRRQARHEAVASLAVEFRCQHTKQFLFQSTNEGMCQYRKDGSFYAARACSTSMAKVSTVQSVEDLEVCRCSMRNY